MATIEVKRQYVALLKVLYAVVEGSSEAEDPGPELDRLGEQLWGCQDVIDAPVDALDVIGLEKGATFHEAVLTRALCKILDEEQLAPGQSEIETLHAVFLKAAPEPHDRATFKAWLRDHTDVELED